MALTDIIERLLEPIIQRLKDALKPFSKVISYFTRLYESFTSSYSKGVQLASDIQNEIDEFRNFRENVNFRTRVISIPKAIDQTEELIAQVRAAWDAIIELAKELQKQIQGGQKNPTEEAEEALADIQNSGFRTLIEKFPRLFKAFEKLLGFVAILLGALESIALAIDDLTQIVAAVRGLREEIETGSTLFLKNTNPRRTLRTDDGEVFKIRVGNLHS